MQSVFLLINIKNKNSEKGNMDSRVQNHLIKSDSKILKPLVVYSLSLSHTKNGIKGLNVWMKNENTILQMSSRDNKVDEGK